MPRPTCRRSSPAVLAALPAAIAAGSVLLPVAAGLLGTLLPAFGWLPALGGAAFGLGPWRRLLAQPGLGASVRLTVAVGLGATAFSLLAVVLFCAAFHDRRLFRRAQAAIIPVLATPHAALALGFAALAAPSGLLARLLSPWATGWTRPPDLATVNDAWGLSLTLGLALKEAPFLLLMTLAALNQVPAARLLAVARTLGQPAPTAWLKAVFPLAYRQIRLPVLAVLAYALSAADVALILGPGSPPPLAVLALRWFTDPDATMAFPAAAASCLLLALTLGAMAAWWLGERAAGALFRRWAASGRDGAGGRGTTAPLPLLLLLRVLGGPLLPAMLLLALLSLAAVALWSVAGPWRYPDALPARLDGATWAAQAGALAGPAWTTLAVSGLAAAAALPLVVAALEAISRHGAAARPGLLALTFLPLLLPQAAFLFGMQVALLRLGLDGGWVAVAWAHLVFVLPYVLLSLAQPWAALDPRLARVAACLGASPARVLLRVKLPILLRPILAATAVGVAVSTGQYLATLLAGGGRLSTLTTEAVTLAAGGDRRVLGVFAVLQAAIPLLAYALALGLPRVVWRGRAGLLRGA